MRIERAFKAVLYFGFLVCALVSIKQSADEFFQGSTTYYVNQEPITMADLPTLGVCMQLNLGQEHLVYGKDFTVDVNVNGKATKTLVINQSVKTWSRIRIHMKEIWQNWMQMVKGNKWQCFKISPKCAGDKTINFQQFFIKFVFKFSNASFYPFDTNVVATSEGNSYGLANGRYFDGIVEKEVLKEQHVLPLYMYQYELSIVKVVEYHNMESTCSQVWSLPV